MLLEFPQHVAFTSPSWVTQQEEQGDTSVPVSKVAHHHFSFILFIRSESLSPANIQGEEN